MLSVCLAVSFSERGEHVLSEYKEFKHDFKALFFLLGKLMSITHVEVNITQI